MTDERKELIERWALEAGAIGGIEKIMDRSALSRFAELVRADALEEAAKAVKHEMLPDDHEAHLEYWAANTAYKKAVEVIRKLIQAP